MVGVINAPTDGSQTLAQYQSAAGKAANSVTPPTVQGGVIGPVKAATTSSSSGASPSSKNAGERAVGDVQWLMLAIAGAMAITVGELPGLVV